jgi:hypothetical protein
MDIVVIFYNEDFFNALSLSSRCSINIGFVILYYGGLGDSCMLIFNLNIVEHLLKMI